MSTENLSYAQCEAEANWKAMEEHDLPPLTCSDQSDSPAPDPNKTLTALVTNTNARNKVATSPAPAPDKVTALSPALTVTGPQDVTASPIDPRWVVGAVLLLALLGMQR